jgi:hypothetical protein
MPISNTPITDEAVHKAAQRLRETLQISDAQQRADVYLILAWIARQTEVPESYRRPTAAVR